MERQELLQKIERLESIIQRQGFNLLALHQLAKIVVSNTDIRQIFFLITDMFAEIFQLKYCVSFMLNTENRNFEFSYSIRFDEKKVEDYRFDMNSKLVDRVFSKLIWKYSDSEVKMLDEEAKKFLNELQVEYIIPLKVFDRYLGFVCFSSRFIEKEFDEAELVLIEIMQNIISTSLYNAMTLDMLAEDGATGLFSEHYFLRRIDETISLAKRYNFDFTICIISISNFDELLKQGHSANSVLRVMASKLKKTFRVTDYVSRIDQRDFCVLLNRTSGDNIKKPFQRLSKELENIEIKVGAATYPRDGIERNVLIDKAKERMLTAEKNEVKHS